MTKIDVIHNTNKVATPDMLDSPLSSFLSKESASTTVACVYMVYERLMEQGKMQKGSRG